MTIFIAFSAVFSLMTAVTGFFNAKKRRDKSESRHEYKESGGI